MDQAATKSSTGAKTKNAKDLSELTRLYSDADNCDSDLFAEMRSNVLLVASDHYTKQGSRYWNRVRESKDLNEEQKIRLTKNYIYKIMRGYSNAVVSFAPFVQASAQDEQSQQDEKAAELHNKYLNYSKRKYRLREKIRDWGNDFTDIGEVATKIFYDPNRGTPVGFAPAYDDEGNLQFDEGTGEIKSSGDLVYGGEFVFEKLYGFNLLRDPKAKAWEESPYVIIRKMAATKSMREKYKDDPEKLKAFKDTTDQTYLVFDMNRTSYGRTQGQCMIRETYYRPCPEYPKGYFYFWTEHGIFEEGELPFGVWPIAFAPFDKFQTSPRGRSHIKILRPFQAELNRSASKIAEHQITLGDDKIVTQAGAEIQEGGILPGVRGITVAGPAPQILPGRSGSQYFEYMNGEIDKMFKASLLDWEMEEIPAQLDPYTLLYKAASQRKKFSIYTERFEQFLVDVFTIFLELSRKYVPDDELKEVFGVMDLENISEFKNPKKLCYILELEPSSDDIATQLGKQMITNHFVQFAGAQLGKEDIGKLLKSSPYMGKDDLFEDLTLDYDKARNMLLSLDRGKPPVSHSNDNHSYIIQKLLNRMSKPDYELLSPQIKQLYEQTITLHEQAQAKNIQTLKAQNADFIPTGGALVVCDLYVQDPKNPLSSKRARLPYESLNWLIQRLDQQGSTLGALESMDGSTKSTIMSMGGSHGQGMPPAQHQSQPQPMQVPQQ